MPWPGASGRFNLAAIVDSLRRPAGLWVITLVALLLGSWLGVSGLFLRIFGKAAAEAPLPWIEALSFGPNLLSWLSMSTQGWLRLVTGCGLAGAVMGLWLHQPWAFRSTQLLTLLSLLFLGIASIAAPLIWICLALPSTLGWFQPVIEPDADSIPA